MGPHLDCTLYLSIVEFSGLQFAACSVVIRCRSDGPLGYQGEPARASQLSPSVTLSQHSSAQMMMLSNHQECFKTELRILDEKRSADGQVHGCHALLIRACSSQLSSGASPPPPVQPPQCPVVS